MSPRTNEIAKMIDSLPATEQELAYEFVKRLVLAWDPDYTKVTVSEAQDIQNAEKSGFLNDAEIDWDNLSKYA